MLKPKVKVPCFGSPVIVRLLDKRPAGEPWTTRGKEGLLLFYDAMGSRQAEVWDAADESIFKGVVPVNYHEVALKELTDASGNRFRQQTTPNGEAVWVNVEDGTLNTEPPLIVDEEDENKTGMEQEERKEKGWEMLVVFTTI